MHSNEPHFEAGYELETGQSNVSSSYSMQTSDVLCMGKVIFSWRISNISRFLTSTGATGEKDKLYTAFMKCRPRKHALEITSTDGKVQITASGRFQAPPDAF